MRPFTRRAAHLEPERWWVGVAVLLLPRWAEACPMCASQQHGGTARIAALGVMLLLPFAVAFIVFGVLRRANGRTAPLSASPRRLARLWFGLSWFRLRRRRPAAHPPLGQ